MREVISPCWVLLLLSLCKSDKWEKTLLLDIIQMTAKMNLLLHVYFLRGSETHMILPSSEIQQWVPKQSNVKIFPELPHQANACMRTRTPLGRNWVIFVFLVLSSWLYARHLPGSQYIC